MVDPYDHTAEFDPKDISDNKVICMLIYLTGAIGIFIALLASSTSQYVAFHVRQALKFLVVYSLMAIVLALVFSGIMLVYCSAIVTPELMETILANSMTSENTQVSMTTATAGDNIQSVLMYTAFAGLGALVGNRIRRKKTPAPVAESQNEYDN